ncbi:dystrotelin-like [Oncorhynchus clarkii lewisi]|uniref:dystrotelin-like n=1 Tax=Oncorhynchus clarkii lewisi TaxID=490388 RepID=UPI0039B9B5EE
MPSCTLPMSWNLPPTLCCDMTTSVAPETLQWIWHKSSNRTRSPPGLRHTKRFASQTPRIFNFNCSTSTLNAKPKIPTFNGAPFLRAKQETGLGSNCIPASVGHKCDTLMDMDSIEGLNEVRPAVYRTAMKLRSLQKLCHMHVVTLRELIPALCSLGGARDTGVGLSEQEVRQCINRMFQSVSQEVPGQVSAEAPEQTCRLLYRLFDRGQTGAVCCRSVEAALISLSADTLSAKHKALVRLAERCSGRESGTVSRSGLRVVLQDLSQVPAVVQENHVFGSAETAVRSCFSGVLSACVCEEHVLSWLQCEPCLLLWLPTLYRLSVSENVTHSVRCHACKAYPITGLRYRCMKCVNLHLCQTCFLTERHTKKHKSSHPVLEHCTQPSWKESLASLAYSARHALLPRRYTHREAERRRCLIRAESRGEPQTSFTTPDPSPQSAAEDTPPDDRAPPTNPPQLLATPSAVRPRKASKALQTEEEQEEAQPQRRDSVLIKDIKDLQRDKWLLERELQVWRVTVQSEQGSLEYRCSEMEANMETLRQHNLRLQDMMSQALSMSGKHADIMPHANVIPHAKYRPERDIACPVESQSSASSSGSREREEEEREEEDECCTAKMQRNEMKTEEQRGDDDEEEEQTETDSVTETHTPTITSNPQPCDGQVTGPMKDQSVSEEEYSGMCSLAEEKRLCELVQRLISELSLHTYTHTDCRQELELLEAAEEVGDSVCHLVYAVNTHSVPNTHTSCPILLHNHRPEYVSKRLL